MRVLCIFTFTLFNGKKYRIASFSLKQARRTLKRLTPYNRHVKHLDLSLRISLSPLPYAS